MSDDRIAPTKAQMAAVSGRLGAIPPNPERSTMTDTTNPVPDGERTVGPTTPEHGAGPEPDAGQDPVSTPADFDGPLGGAVDESDTEMPDGADEVAGMADDGSGSIPTDDAR